MYGDLITQNLLLHHAFSGCDTTSAAYNMGKLKFIKIMRKHPELARGTALFLSEKVDPSLLTLGGERFFVTSYGGNRRLTRRLAIKTICQDSD